MELPHVSHVVDKRFVPVAMRCGWNIPASEDAVLNLTEACIAGLTSLVQRASVSFLREGTWVERCFGVQSLVVRVDHNGLGNVYEIEPRPAGMGVVMSVLPTTTGAALRAALHSGWKHLRVIVAVSPERMGSIDDIDAGFEVVGLDEALRRSELVLPRTFPHETRCYALRGRSISPISTEHSKAYGVPLGLWKSVTSADVFRALTRGKPFVVKSDGTRSEQVFIWCPGQPTEEFLAGIKGITPLYLQEYFPHMPSPFAFTCIHGGDTGEPWQTLYRSFFVFDISRREFVHAATCWVAAPRPPVHGTPEAIMGPVIVGP